MRPVRSGYEDARLHPSLQSQVNSTNWTQIQHVLISLKDQDGFYLDTEKRSELRIYLASLPLDEALPSRASRSGVYFQQLAPDNNFGIPDHLPHEPRPFSSGLPSSADCQSLELLRVFADLAGRSRFYKESDSVSLICSIGFRSARNGDLLELDRRFSGTFKTRGPEGRVDYAAQHYFLAGQIPHLRVIMQTELRPESENILTSEVVMISRAIISNMCASHETKHEVFPVMMLSCCGTSARCVIGWYNKNGSLILRKTPFVDFRSENLAGEEIILRWFLGTAVGETTERTQVVASNRPMTRSQTARSPLRTASSSFVNRELPQKSAKPRLRAEMPTSAVSARTVR